MEPRYRCTECGSPAILLAGEILRVCDHKEAGVTADMKAHAVSVSRVAERQGQADGRVS